MTTSFPPGHQRYRPGRASSLVILVLGTFLLIRETLVPEAAPAESDAPPADLAADAATSAPVVIRTAPVATPDLEAAAAETAAEAPVPVPDTADVSSPADVVLAADEADEEMSDTAAAAETAEETLATVSADDSEPSPYRGASGDGLDLARLRIIGADTEAGLDHLVAKGLVVLEFVTPNGVYIGANPSDARQPMQTLSYARKSALGGDLSLLELQPGRALIDRTRDLVANDVAIKLGVGELTDLNLLLTAEAVVAIIAAQDEAVATARSSRPDVTAGDLTLRGCFTGPPTRFAIESVSNRHDGAVVALVSSCAQANP
jgi:hypothetical protein